MLRGMNDFEKLVSKVHKLYCTIYDIYDNYDKNGEKRSIDQF